ncbi:MULTISPECIES: hypothetical protein [Rhizobium]|uniref:hypothetical protein n=1 Tax=Rhizobium TaxID=379 RepID=UPI001B337A01|nr:MULTISPECIES: hypothetical protein [Rhizobium]MBX4911216.1 hypothetical protein [Rhizobium bangladeshense]MBX5260333.1 hypothetical protein [Rhizobium sp. NLR16b]MBX5266423.1 hypothetical protein [Rhizobium sp. NLR16a]MBX5314991.1 hypothetical protein [Rhizobium sp. NLR11b]QTU98149.1 hypothetical protein J7U39_08315 [Rhizobium sp. NLR16a]
MSLAYFARNAASAVRARKRIRREGYNMRGHKLWSEAEDAVVRKFAPDYAKIHKKLPHRTLVAIGTRCRRLGLKQRFQHIYSASEISKLRRLYARASKEEICAAFPHSTWINIQQVARYHHIRRDRCKNYCLTGFPTLDEVRRRCREIRWSMPDLDKAAKTGTYFSRAGWIGKKINHRALGRAIEALDGVVKADWNE